MPEAKPDRRRTKNSDVSPTMQIMLGYERMGTSGRRRLMLIGIALLSVGVGVGLFGDFSQQLAVVIIRVLFAAGVAFTGVCFIFPQLGLLLIDRIPNALAKFAPTKLGLTRLDRRNDSDGDEE